MADQEQTDSLDTTDTTVASSDRKYANPSENAAISNEEIQTALWTQYLPESYGIRASIQNSKYRWCAREAGLWGIATGTAMSIHRLRMNRMNVVRAVNFGFATTGLVMTASYYFCVKRRDYEENMIQLMMRMNSFQPAETMPEQLSVSSDDHPFLEQIHGDDDDGVSTKQYVATIPERKEWQPQQSQQDLKDIVKPT